MDLARDGAVPPTALRALPVESAAPLYRPLRGATVALAELAERLPWSSLPPDADPDSASVVLLGGWRPFRMQRRAGRMVTPLPLDLVADEVRRWIHVDRCWYYLECRRGGATWRSGVDWLVLDAPRW